MIPLCKWKQKVSIFYPKDSSGGMWDAKGTSPAFLPTNLALEEAASMDQSQLRPEKALLSEIPFQCHGLSWNTHPKVLCM